MRTLNLLEMASLFCPFSGDTCIGHKCIACEQVHGEVIMEDHSGNGLRMREIASKRGRSAKDIVKTGSHSEAVLKLAAEYTCRRVYPENANE